MSIAFPIEVAGIDVSGQRFSDQTKTTTVSRFGCCVPLPHVMQPDQRIHLRRIGTSETAVGRIVASLGTQPGGRLYGVATRDSCEGLWGIRFSTHLYEKLLDTVHEGVYFVNRERQITFWSDGAEKVSGFGPGETVGRHCTENFMGHIDDKGRPLCLTGCPLTSVMKDGQPRTAEFFMRHKQGHRIPITVRVMPMRDGEGKVVGAVEVFSDGSSRNNVEKRVTELEHLAFRDALTGLPNRRYLQMKVEQALQEHQRFGRLYGLVMFDLDRFKSVNDTYGHDVGDMLLKEVSKTLLQGQRVADVIGRWGGEEFLVLMPDLNAVELGDLTERCRVLIAQATVVSGQSAVSATASIGATVLTHSDSAISALRRVDELMYQSKHSGGDRTTAG